MIFKPSSLPKLFFTYICPRFYGGAPAAPSNTTSTSTVNQSPWQNPVYQALMLGTADKPGPATSMLNASRDQMAQWNAVNKAGLDPATQASLGSWNPNVAGSTAAYTNNLNAATGQYVPTANPNVVANNSPIEQNAAQGGIMGLKGYAAGKTAKQTAAALAKQIETLQKPVKGETANQAADRVNKIISLGGEPNPANTSFLQNYTDAQANQWEGKIDPKTGVEAPTPRGAGQSSADYAKYMDSIKEKGYTSPDAPAGKAPYSLTDTLKKVAYFDPTTGESTLADFQAIQQKARDLGTPDQYTKGTDAYNQALAATQALQAYSPENIAADELTQYQMQGPSAVNAPTAGTNQMAGPQSFLDQGVAEAYMSPYMQNVVDIQKREADRAYRQQGNELNAQAVKSGAFGGSRQAIQQAEAARNQNMLLNDIQAKGQQEAYTSGMGQFNAAQGQQMQAGQANLTTAQQTALANQAAQIQAMMANQGMDYNTAVQNLQAQMGIQNTQATQNLAAQQANQSAGLQANQQNLGTAQQLGNIGQGLAGIGTAQNAAQLANLGAQGQVAQAEQNLGQSYLDAQSGNATSWLNAPTAINAGAANVLNAQPVSGGTTSTTGTAAPAHWARGGLIKNGKVSKGSKK